MANLIITTRCQRNCPYCFAIKGNEKITWENFDKALEFFLRSPMEDQLNLMGGEPTLHPRFFDFFTETISRGFKVTVFTNGMIDKGLLYELEKYGKENNWANFDFLININDFKLITEEEDIALDRTLRALHKVSTIGYNIHDPECDLSFLVDMVKEYETQLSVRLGIAHPNIDKTNKFLDIRGCKAARKAIMNISEEKRFISNNIIFDCGFPRCMFSNSDVEEFFSKTNFSCAPAVDVFPDLTAAPCYAFSDKRVNLLDFENSKALRSSLESLMVGKNYMTEDCDKCKFFNESCTGGCRAH